MILVITGVVLSSVYRRRDRARLRPPAQPLSAHPDRRSRDPGRAARPPVPVARRAAVRTAAVRLVLADHPHRFREARDARLAFAVGQEAAQARRARRRSDRRRHPPRLCRRARGPESARGRAAGRSRRRRQIPGQRRRRRLGDFRRDRAASTTISAAPSPRSASCCC